MNRPTWICIEGEISRFAAELEEILEGMETNLVNITRREEDIRRLQQTIADSLSTQTDGEEKLKADMERKEALSGRQKNFFAGQGKPVGQAVRAG